MLPVRFALIFYSNSLYLTLINLSWGHVRPSQNLGPTDLALSSFHCDSKQCFGSGSGSGRIRIIWSDPDPDPYQEALIWIRVKVYIFFYF